MSNHESTTEEKIKETARRLFHKNGFDGTKTRDIAEAAGINLALMNYYFRSKKKLFDLIMLETVETFFQSVFEILWNAETSIAEKIDDLTVHYIDMLQEEPDMAVFILSEIRKDPTAFLEKILKGRQIQQSSFFQQLNKNQNTNHQIHRMINFISIIVFPFAARPLIMEFFTLEKPQFQDLMEERKKMIPRWMHLLTGSQSDIINHKP